MRISIATLNLLAREGDEAALHLSGEVYRRLHVEIHYSSEFERFTLLGKQGSTRRSTVLGMPAIKDPSHV